MNLMLLEHHFGKEVEFSFQQLFNYFCNTFCLGQWEATKSCLNQLHSINTNLNSNLGSLLLELIETPEFYCQGSFSVESPYHMAKLLYDYCLENNYINLKKEKYLDKIVIRALAFSLENQANFLIKETFKEHEEKKTSGYPDKFKQSVIAELTDFCDLNQACKFTMIEKAAECVLHADNLNSLIPISISSSSVISELSNRTINVLENLLIQNPLKAKSIFAIILKYNKEAQIVIFKVHLNAAYKVLNSVNENSIISDLLRILSFLEIYNTNVNSSPEIIDVQKHDDISLINNFELSKIKEETRASLELLLNDVCKKFNSLWFNNTEKLDQAYVRLYSSFLTRNDHGWLQILCQISYKLESQLLVNSTQNESTCLLLSLVKIYGGLGEPACEKIWRRVFQFCCVERKLMIKMLIEQCILLVLRGEFESLAMIFTVKQLIRLKPLILLIGLSHVNDIHSGRKLVSILCASNEKSTLTFNIGDLVKTHIEFSCWFQEVKAHEYDKDLSFNDLMQMLHKKFPLNIIAKYVDLSKIDNKEISKIIRNTLSDKTLNQLETEKTRLVRFADEVNEDLTKIQEACITAYTGFYCINQLLIAVMYCYENLNPGTFMNEKQSKCVQTCSSTFFTDSDINNSHLKQCPICSTNEKLKVDYKTNVLDRLDSVRKFFNQLTPLNYRLEVLENIYSLIYLTSHDLKLLVEIESNEEDEIEKPNLTNQASKKDFLIENEVENDLIRTDNEIVNTVEKIDTEDIDFCIYMGSEELNRNNSKADTRSSKNSSFTSYRRISNSANSCKYSDDLEDFENINYRKRKKSLITFYQQNVHRCGQFLVNEFFCRDILQLVKDLLQELHAKSIIKQDELDTSNCSITSVKDLNSRVIKLQELVNSTIWRFQLITRKETGIDYGLITTNQEPTDINKQQKTQVYELMKKRKEKEMTRKGVSGSINNNIVSSRSNVFSRQNALIDDTLSATRTGRDHSRRRAESKRSLSLVYSLGNKNYSNSIISKLLANIGTLLVLLLKEGKLEEATQLVKKHSLNKEIQGTFEFREVIFSTIYSQTLDELAKLNAKQQLKYKLQTTLIEKSMQSLQLDKLTENMLVFDKNNELLQCLCLCDVLSISYLDLELSSQLTDFARIKLNSILNDASNLTCTEYQNASDIANESGSDFEDKKRKRKDFDVHIHANEKIQFQVGIQRKLAIFIKACELICNGGLSSMEKAGCSTLVQFLSKYDGVNLDFNEEVDSNALLQNMEVSTMKYKSLKGFTDALGQSKLEFDRELDKRNVAGDEKEYHNEEKKYFTIIDLLNELVNLNENKDLISKYFFKYNTVSESQEILKNRDFAINSIEKIVYKSVALKSSHQRQIEPYKNIILDPSHDISNYLLSFYEYCRTLYDYFKDNNKNIPIVKSYFSILNFSPASLICKLLFEDSIKPELIEPLTEKLNLNLTAIILHSSCPRLKLKMKVNKPYNISMHSKQHFIEMTEKRGTAGFSSIEQPAFSRSQSYYPARLSSGSQKMFQKCDLFFNTNSFCTVLNKTDISCCSRKKPDEFLRDLLSKLLKYCRNFLSFKNKPSNKHSDSESGERDFILDNKTENTERLIDLKTAQRMFKCAEFKSILNETQDLQHLNLYFLKTDNQKLSFFINLYNLLCIHSHFYLASVRVDRKVDETFERSDSSPFSFSFNLFHNRTERLLFQQRMCYKVGQMGSISLYDLKHLILMPRFLNNPHTTSISGLSSRKSAKIPHSRKSSAHSADRDQYKSTNDIKQLKSKQSEPAALHKYAFFKLDLVAEPLWLPFLPSEKAVCDYRIRFALNNCTESDPPISVYNSDELLEDQLEMQMNLFLNDSVYVDLCEDVLYLPSFLIDQFPLFLPSTSGYKSRNNAIMDPETTLDMLPSFQSDLENLIRFLIDHVSEELSKKLIGLLELDQVEDFVGGENLDEFGRRILSFPIELLPKSNKFSLVIDYDYKINKSNTRLFSTPASDIFSSSWYGQQVKGLMALNERSKQVKKLTSSESSEVFSVIVNSQLILNTEATISDLKTRNLNKDCLDYIHKNFPVISNSLSFLYDKNKRDEFFKQLTNEIATTSPISNIEKLRENSTDSLLTSDYKEVSFNNSLSWFIQLYVPLKHMKHLGMQKKLNMITQFLLTNNKTDESKIELIIDLANYYAEKQEWKLVIQLLESCTQDNEEFNDFKSQWKNNLIASKLTFSLEDSSDLTSTVTPSNTNNSGLFTEQNNNVRFSQKDLYNLYDHACICHAYQEAKQNQNSFIHLYKIKNFLRQIRAIFGLMHMWPIESCLEMVEYCLTKAKLFETTCVTTTPCYNSVNLYSCASEYDSFEIHTSVLAILNKKKQELIAYKDLTICAGKTLAKYYEHQQIQDAAGLYDNKQINSAANEISLNVSINGQDADEALVNLSRVKKVCQKCLTWQYAKHQLESPVYREDETTNDLIMDLFLFNDSFSSAKYLIRKLKLSRRLQFKLDYGHLKYRLLNLNAGSSIIVFDLDAVLVECVTFNQISTVSNCEPLRETDTPAGFEYVFEICYKLLNELKTLNDLNNQVLIGLSEYLLSKYEALLTKEQTADLKTVKLTASIFQFLVKQLSNSFETYKRHHSDPLLIIEQLLMNSHIELCSRAVQMCRESMPHDMDLIDKINKILVWYARKALEFKVYKSNTETSSSIDSHGLPQSTLGLNKKNWVTNSIRINSSPRTSTSSNSLHTSASFKSFHKLSSQSFTKSSNIHSFSCNITPDFQSPSNFNTECNDTFVMPPVPPSKEEWVKDENVNECMVCQTGRFNLLNRRHHCRRCGRVVCSNCSQKVTLIENVPRRTCDDCFKQTERLKFHENRLKTEQLRQSSEGDILNNGSRRPIQRASSTSFELGGQQNNTLIDDTITNWQLLGSQNAEKANNSQTSDEMIRASFRYQQAPSTSLCLSILDLHDQPNECGKDLLSMADDLSKYLSTTNYLVEDFALIINMIKYLLHNAKVKLLQNSSSNYISLCDTYLSLIDVLEQLLLANCFMIPSLYELRNTESCRRIRYRLLEEERHELAMNLSTKCGLDTQAVWASWGLIELRRGNYNEARDKFAKCLKADKNSSQNQLQVLNDLVGYLENAAPIRAQGPQTLLAPLRSVESLLAEPKLYVSEDMMDDMQLNESIFYLETYGNHALIISFYQRHGYLKRAINYILDSRCSSDIFVENLLIGCLRNGEFFKLLDTMLEMEPRVQSKLYAYYGSIGKHLERNAYINTLYEFQLFMKDYVRASMSCICFFSKMCRNYCELYANIEYLVKARHHLEQYLEVYSSKHCMVSTQQQHKGWRNKPEQPSLTKQISAQEIDKLMKAINLQIEVTKFLNSCLNTRRDEPIFIQYQPQPTLFSSNDTKINLCCLILLSGKSIQEGFGFVIRIIQCFSLKAALVYSHIASELAKKYNFKEIHNLLKSINESGYNEEQNLSYDECISTCIRVFAASTNSIETHANQQYNKEIDELIRLIINDENRINAYILNGRLRSAYLIAIKIERVDIVKHIANVAERIGQNLIKDICNKWLEKKLNS